MKKLKVWWIPQIPMTSFEVEVHNLAEAKLLIETLAQYDLFQFENKVKPDYSNAGGLVEWDEVDQEWLDWCNSDGDTIDDLTYEQCCELDLENNNG